IHQPFEEIKEQAFNGSDYGKEKINSKRDRSFYNKILLGALIIFLLRSFSNRKQGYKLTKKKPKRFKKRLHGEYDRNYPYEANMSDVYYRFDIMGASNFEKLLTSFILKWVKDERITV